MNSEMKGKKILVTGGAGCIGSHLTQKLSELGANVTIFDNMMRGEEALRNIREVMQTCSPEVVIGDILDIDKVKEVLSQGFDVIYHLAALPSHRLALERPREYAMVDIMGTVNVLEAARKSKLAPTVVFASSNKVYGKQKPPFREDMNPMPEGPYGQAKKSSEEWCMQYSKYYGLNTPIIRYHHVLGPRTQPDREISIFTERVICGQNPIVHGKTEKGKFISCAADYTDVRDAVDGTISAASIKGVEIFNLATGKLTTVERVAELVMKFLGKNLPIEHKEMLPHESLVHLSDVSKAAKVLKFKPRFNVEQSVKSYVDWRLKTGPRRMAVYR
jgi:nucleoside-diphosphate-sugar epimerase